MKSLVAALGAVLAITASARAIPQNFNQGNAFLLQNGVAFEQAAANPAAWENAADLKGKWTKRGATTLVLAESAVVFGVQADEITAERSGDQLQSIRVVFREKTAAGRAGKSSDLLGQVMTNVQVFTGNDGRSVKDGGTAFSYKALTITVRRGHSHEVTVEFTRST
jgi:hypothetical protein